LAEAKAASGRFLIDLAGGHMMSIKSVKIPGVGMRNVKTALAAAFCAFIYYFFDRSPAFACIGAIFGMGSDMEDSRKNGGNRLFGTLIGGLLGMVLFRLYLFIEPTGKYTLWLVPLTFIGTVILIVLCQMFWVGGVQPGGVVLCILLFNTPVATYISYALNRILDTTIGVLVAWAVSYIFPRGWMEMWKERIKAHRAAK
jgi:uncharacterized membrane protein YgaE (UPF0421/DUF939 family)